MLEGIDLKMLRPGERCVHRLKLLCGQVCIMLGEIEAARQLLTDGYATSQHTFGIGDVLTMEFQTRLAEVYIGRREIEVAMTYLGKFGLYKYKSGRSDICAITAQNLVAKVVYITGSSGKAESTLKNCLDRALSIVEGDHPLIWRIRYDIIEVKVLQKDYATAEKYFREFRDVIIEAKGPGHPEVLYMTLDLAWLKLRMGGIEEAGLICEALLVQQQKTDTDIHDLITLTKTVLWICHRRRTDTEIRLKDDLLKSLEDGSMPNPRLVRRWEVIALLAEKNGAVDVASVLKKRYHKATELAFGVEYLQAMIRKEASPEDSNSGYSLSSMARWWQRCVFWTARSRSNDE